MRKRLYQVAPIVREKDATGRMALSMVPGIERLGFQTRIFTERQHSFGFRDLCFGPLRKGLLRSEPWAGMPAPEISLYHHSIGTEVAERFLAWPARRKILLFHNITPSDSSNLSTIPRKDTTWGREQLPRLIESTDLQIALSAFSCKELRECGAKHLVQLPYLLPESAWNIQARSRAREPLVLIVGRVVPHKQVLLALEGWLALAAKYPELKLAILGNKKSDPQYTRAIEKRIEAAGVGARARVLGKVSESRLRRYYRKASALLTVSDHEGFCVPIAEAICASVPVVGFASGAIPETLGGGGILLRERSPNTIAEALERVVFDEKTRDDFVQAQKKERERFAPEEFSQQFENAIRSL